MKISNLVTVNENLPYKKELIESITQNKITNAEFIVGKSE